MKVAVGSKNPVKIEAVRRAFEKAFGNCEIKEMEASSGIASTPFGLDEIVKGARNRAKEALSRAGADYGVGLEGGLEETGLGVFLIDAAVVMDKKGKVGIGKGTGILMPEAVVRKVRHDKELGAVIDELSGESNSKQRGGASGYLTRSLIDRTEATYETVIMALARFLRPELYEK